MAFFKKYLKLNIILVIIAATFVAGFFVGKGQDDLLVVNEKGEPVKSGQVRIDRNKVQAFLSQDANFDLYLQVWKMLQERYVDQPVSATKLFYGSLEGMVASLEDPYSVFLTPQVSEEFAEQLNGRFEGIGAELGIKNKLLTVISPLAGSPAEKAGLLAKDWIIAINTESTEPMTLDQAVSKIRGEKGTTVVLSIKREGKDEPFDVTITRDTTHIESVVFKMKENNIAYIQLTNFNQDTTNAFKNIERQVIEANPKGIIFDLRNNPGGYLQTAVDVASAWVDGKPVVVERSKIEGERKYFSQGRAVFSNIPTVVLTNGGSASSSEIVAGALQDYGLAYIIGEKTFGKGSVQVLEELPDGSSVKFTVAKWYTPKDRSIDKDGIAPNEEVKLTAEDYSADRDPQMDRAIEYLKNKK